MRKITLTTVATSAILATAALLAGVANASPLGAATKADLRSADTPAVEQVGWSGGYYRPYAYYHHHRPFHHRFFFFHRRFHHHYDYY